jgi:hypothetical protein
MALFTVNIACTTPDIQQAVGVVGSTDSDHHRGRSLDYGVSHVDPAQSILLLAIFLAGTLALLYDVREGTINPVFRIINRSIVAPWDLNAFLHLESEPPDLINTTASLKRPLFQWGMVWPAFLPVDRRQLII